MTRRDRIVVLILVGVAALAAFWFLVLGPKRDEADKLGKQAAAAELRRDQAQASVDASRAARAQYAADYATVARLGKAVPVDDDVPGLVYQLSATAGQAGVDFRSVKLDAGGAGGSSASSSAPAPSAPSSSGSQGASGQSGSGSQPVAAPAPGAAASQSATATLPPGATVGPAGFPTMPFSFTFEGSFFRLADFFRDVERYIKPAKDTVAVRGRLLMVNGISLTAAGRGFPLMRAQVSAMAYLLPADQGLTNGASPAAPGTGQPVSATTTAAPPTTAATAGAAP
ncbi:MAG: hypothetical protein U0R70_16245 [Solirubrobacteraceae bacterium]